MIYSRKSFLFAVALAFFVAGIATAQEDAHGRDVEEILQQIIQVQGVERVGQIDANAVDRDLLEELGDGVMGLMIADDERHEWMDRMMGGEGSAELASTHAWLGYNYLQNDGNLASFGPGMMGFGMMGPGMMGGWNWGADRNGPWSETWGDRGSWYGGTPFSRQAGTYLWIIGLLVLVLIVAIIVALVRTRTPRHGSQSGKSGESAVAILQARYARGELSQEEYRQIKKELR